jgi:peptidoglycan/xylan/chitin deacetylase (PgdA/CDA1 family)
MKKSLAARWLSTTGLRRTLSAVWPSHGVLVLNYHRIGDASLAMHDRALWNASADGFEEQVRYLKAHAELISLQDIEQAITSRGRHVVITFDDGYRDNYEVAFPVLRQHDATATFFVATGFIDDRTLAWWDAIAFQVRNCANATIDMAPWIPFQLAMDGDREAVIQDVLRAYKRLPGHEVPRFRQRLEEQTGVAIAAVADDQWMTWDMVREMKAAGMTIGGHTHTHPVLSSLSEDAQRLEIATCARRMREELDQPMEFFSYPVGSPFAFNDATRRCLADAGVSMAFSYYGGFVDQLADRFDVPRVAMESHIGRDLFRAMTDLPRMFCRPDE